MAALDTFETGVMLAVRFHFHTYVHTHIYRHIGLSKQMRREQAGKFSVAAEKPNIDIALLFRK